MQTRDGRQDTVEGKPTSQPWKKTCGRRRSNTNNANSIIGSSLTALHSLYYRCRRRRQPSCAHIITISMSRRSWHRARALVMHLRYIIVSCSFRLSARQTAALNHKRKQRTDELPAVLSHVVQIDSVTRERVSVSRRIDASSSQLLCVLVGEIPVVPLIEHSICKHAP